MYLIISIFNMCRAIQIQKGDALKMNYTDKVSHTQTSCSCFFFSDHFGSFIQVLCVTVANSWLQVKLKWWLWHFCPVGLPNFVFS